MEERTKHTNCSIIIMRRRISLNGEIAVAAVSSIHLFTQQCVPLEQWAAASKDCPWGAIWGLNACSGHFSHGRAAPPLLLHSSPQNNMNVDIAYVTRPNDNGRIYNAKIHLLLLSYLHKGKVAVADRSPTQASNVCVCVLFLLQCVCTLQLS